MRVPLSSLLIKELLMSQIKIKFLIAVLLAALLTGCGSQQSAGQIPANAVAGDVADWEECSYKLNKTRYQAECGDLVVPENRSDPEARLITLPVIRVRALNESPAEPIFWLAGGPGGTNLKFPKLEELLADHDIVLVGYRGVDGSVVLECPEISRAAKGIEGDVLGTASLANFGDATNQCADRLRSEGIDLEGYSIPEIVSDLEDARIALGYERLNLLSASYGTRLAMIYSWSHPEKIHRSAMIAVNPPGHFVWEPRDLDALIAYDAGLCASNPDCSTRTENLAESIRNVSGNMPDRWLGIPIDSGKVGFMTHFMLFHRGTAAAAYDAFLAAEGGDPSGLALMSMAYDLMVPSMVTWGDWIAKGSIDYDPDRDWIKDMTSSDSIMGSPTSLLVGGAAQLRGGWPLAPLPEEFQTVQPSDVETLLISGSVDFSTPAQFAEDELLPSLSNGSQVVLGEFGHVNDLVGFQTTAMSHLLTGFFDTGKVDDSLFDYQPMNFKAKLGFPALAKILVLILAALAVGLVLGASAFLRRVRKRKVNQQ